MTQSRVLIDMVREGVTNVLSGQKFKEYLTAMYKFHNYSYYNSMLIALQMPEASHVAGYSAWKTKFHRNVRSGEKAIVILAPCFSRRKHDTDSGQDSRADSGQDSKADSRSNSKKRICGFRAVNVFDISQTEGRKLPDICSELDFSVLGYDRLLAKLTDIADVPVEFGILHGTGRGSCTAEHILIQEKMPEAQTLKTLVHEIAHSRAHFQDSSGTQKERKVKELEAECIAFIVCSFLGIDTSSYSFEYIASWIHEDGAALIENSMQCIHRVSSSMIKDLQSAGQTVRGKDMV